MKPTDKLASMVLYIPSLPGADLDFSLLIFCSSSLNVMTGWLVIFSLSASSFATKDSASNLNSRS